MQYSTEERVYIFNRFVVLTSLSTLSTTFFEPHTTCQLRIVKQLIFMYIIQQVVYVIKAENPL